MFEVEEKEFKAAPMRLKISVIIPVYNAEKYLDQCLQSVLNQSFTNFELILINDGSKDRSGEICDTYAGKDQRIKVFHQQNAGPAKARNTGIKIARGEYITFVDADDTIEKEYYGDMMKIADQLHPDILISNVKLPGKKSIANTSFPKDVLLKSNQIKEKILSSYYGGNLSQIPSLWNKLYKKTFIHMNNLLIDETRVRAEDYWFNFYAFKNAETCYAIDKTYYNYNTAVDNSVMKTFRKDQFQGFLRTRNELEHNNQELKIKINQTRWDTEFINNSNEFILMCYKNKRYDIVKKILKDKEFKKAIKNYRPVNLHTKIIKKAQLLHLRFVSKLVYKVWSIKLN
ncbi:glycosyltransferase [Empedobacter falsenii]